MGYPVCIIDFDNNLFLLQGEGGEEGASVRVRLSGVGREPHAQRPREVLLLRRERRLVQEDAAVPELPPVVPPGQIHVHVVSLVMCQNSLMNTSIECWNAAVPQISRPCAI